VVRSATWVVALDTLIALIATVTMFSVIFSVPGMSEDVQWSAGMLFISLPELFYTAVPFGAILAPLFYLLIAFAALTSTISMLEVAVSYWIDERGVSRRRATLLSGAGIFVITALCGLSLGAWGPLSSFTVFGEKAGLFATLDHLVANWLLPLGGLAITLGAGWFLTRETTRAELVDGSQPRWFRYGLWRFFIRYVSPLAVAAIILAVIFFGRDFS
jgi:NSS family neurotransmitter:Na+ symporter